MFLQYSFFPKVLLYLHSHLRKVDFNLKLKYFWNCSHDDDGHHRVHDHDDDLLLFFQ